MYSLGYIKFVVSDIFIHVL